MARLIGLAEASERTGLSVSTLRRRVRARRLPAFRAGSENGKIMLDPQILDLYVRQQLMANVGFDDSDEQCEADEERYAVSSRSTQLSGLFCEEGDGYEQ